jgi:hypothetical protein
LADFRSDISILRVQACEPILEAVHVGQTEILLSKISNDREHISYPTARLSIRGLQKCKSPP